MSAGVGIAGWVWLISLPLGRVWSSGGAFGRALLAQRLALELDPVCVCEPGDRAWTSASIGSPITRCQRSTGSWLVIRVAPRPYRSVGDRDAARLKTPVVENEKFHPAQRSHEAGIATIAFAQGQIAEQPL